MAIYYSGAYGMVLTSLLAKIKGSAAAKREGIGFLQTTSLYIVSSLLLGWRMFKERVSELLYKLYIYTEGYNKHGVILGSIEWLLYARDMNTLVRDQYVY